MLRYTAHLQAYVGQRYLVTVEAFDAALWGLMRGGYRPDDAYLLLHWENDWDATTPGVTVLDGHDAVHAVERILRDHRAAGVGEF